jgi:hypothetical protein
VVKVFQIMPHPSNGGSGPSTLSQHQRLDGKGRHPQIGHLMPPSFSSSSPRTFSMIWPAALSSLSN